MPENDGVMRAMTNDGAFRIVAARTIDTAQGVLAAQNLSGDIARDMADLLPPQILRYLMISTQPKKTVNFEPGERQYAAGDDVTCWPL